MDEFNAGVNYQLDLASGAFTWSDNVYAVFGYDRNEPVNTNEWWTEHIHPEDAMVINEAMDRLTDPASPGWTVQYRFKKADNTYVLVKDEASLTRDESGNPVQLTGTITQVVN